jgi:hypothetical protein
MGPRASSAWRGVRRLCGMYKFTTNPSFGWDVNKTRSRVERFPSSSHVKEPNVTVVHRRPVALAKLSVPTHHLSLFRVPWRLNFHHWASVVCRSSVRPLTFHILINSSEATGPIWTKLWWNGPWMARFQKCVRWSRLPTKLAAKLKIEKRGDEILIVHCCFSISQNELKF